MKVEMIIFRKSDLFSLPLGHTKPNDMEDINRIKVVLVEKKRTNKWLAEQMGVKPSTVSKWCTNSSQPDVASLLKIADLLEVDIKELIVREYKSYIEKVNSLITL